MKFKDTKYGDLTGQHYDGDIDCGYNKLTSLEGAPESVSGNFYCYSNSLTSLEGAPEIVGGNFYCDYNSLTSLQGAPKSVDGDFYCYHNSLYSLEGAPKSVGGNFICDKKLKKGENSYIICSALINGHNSRKDIFYIIRGLFGSYEI